jgi:tetratricopeptide (TPR) repeat protein
MRAKNRRRRTFKYDAALSFAGEDRRHAALLHRYLTRLGFKIFYDADRQAEIWGTTATAFEEIYGPQTRFVIPLISKHYVKKDWTRHEFETATRESRRRRTEFILPIRLDDTRLFGLHDDVIRLDVRDTSIERIAELFARKLQSEQRKRRSSSPRLPLATKTLLVGDNRRAIGLIAAAPIPLSTEYLTRLFPQHDWATVIARSLTSGLLRKDREAIDVAPQVLQALRSDAKEWKELNNLWIERLTPLASHYDTAAFLVLTLIRVRRFEEAAQVAASISQGVRLGHWNTIYLRILNGLRRPKVFRRLRPITQLELINGLGHCLTAGGHHKEALRAYARLRLLSERHRNSWGMGQALINSGVVANLSGDDKSAAKHYLAAARHAKRRRDNFLLGRALGNLAQIYSSEDSEYAQRLLSDSIRAKRIARDFGGVVVGLAVRGSIAVAKNDFRQAAKWFERSAAAGRRIGMLHEAALSTYNHGRALEDAGKMKAAIKLYEAAQTLAVVNGYSDVSVLSLHSISSHKFADGDYLAAEKAATELLAFAEEEQHAAYRLVASHMIACALLAQGRAKESAQRFRMALAEARARNDSEWIVRCVVDSTRTATKHTIGDPIVAKLKAHAQAESTKAEHLIAGGLWDVIATLSAGADDLDGASEAYRTAYRCLSRARNATDQRIGLCRKWYSWAWGARRYREALLALRTTERSARSPRVKAEAIAALDTRAQRLQDLGRYPEAEVLHRDAIRESKRLGLADQCERSLNNLGEALRHQERHPEAIAAFLESEGMARRLGRQDAVLVAAHNRALALKAVRRHSEAEQLLRKCRDEARHMGLFEPYARNLIALAGLAWSRGQLGAATKLYRQALEVCRWHQLPELEVVAALNLSRLLHASRQPRIAAEILKKRRANFDLLPNSSDCFETLARIYEDNNKLAHAAVEWREAANRAGAVDDDLRSRSLEANAMRLEEKLRRSSMSARQIERLLRIETNPRKRFELLLVRLENLVNVRPARRRDKQRAQKAFDDAITFCNENELPEAKARLFLFAGDQELGRPYAKQLHGCKAYLMAIAYSLAGGAHTAARVSSAVFGKIGSFDSPIGEPELRKLHGDLKQYLTVEMSVSDLHTQRFLLWPFHMAASLAPLRHRPDDYLHRMSELTTERLLNRQFSSDRPSARPRGQRPSVGTTTKS